MLLPGPHTLGLPSASLPWRVVEVPRSIFCSCPFHEPGSLTGGGHSVKAPSRIP